MTATRWAMGCAWILSAWMLISPFVVEADSHTAWNFYTAGAIGALLAGAAMLRSDNLAENGLLALGAWLIVSPWIVHLPELPTRQTLLYGVILGGIAWFGRPTYAPKASN
jgi:SPW repeat